MVLHHQQALAIKLHLVVIRKLKSKLQFIQTTLIVGEIVANNLKTVILVSTLRDEKKEYIFALIKTVSLIKKFVDENLYPLLNDKSYAEM